MNEDEIENIAKTIKASLNDNGLVPLPIFNAISQVTVLSPVDLYAFTEEGGVLRVIVSKRPNDDEFLAGKWHIPGKIMIVTDKSFEDTIDRVMKTELPGATLASEPVQFSSDYQATLRGKEHVESYWALIDKVPTGTDGEEIRSVKPEELPQPFLEEQVERIEHAHTQSKNYIANTK